MKYCIGLLLLALSACRAFESANTQATLQAQNTGYVVEATTIFQTAQAEQTLTRGTAQAAETTIAQADSINRQLMATARVVIPPTLSRVGGGAPGLETTPGAGGVQFVETSISGGVRDEDSCPLDSRSQFTPDDPEIYITTRAVNIRAGTQMSVEWRYEGQTIWQESFTVSADDDDYCLYFYIDPATVTLSPGSWTARLYADGQAISAEVPFTILDAMPEGG